MSSLWRAVALALVAVGSQCLGADASNFEPQDGVLVLRNGYVLQGRITPVNDTFLVTVSTGGEVRLPRAEVEFQCRNMDDAYLRQRDALTSDDPAAHLVLAEWCLRHRLLARASDQLLVVYLQEPDHPRLAALEQRLNSLAVQSNPSPTGTKPTTESIPPPSSSTAKLSPQLMQQFTTVIQPILLNRCAAYTCHGNGSSGKYRLIRPSTGHATTSRVTQRNLQATQLFIDQEQPDKSLLIELGSEPHGGSKNPAFTEKQAHQFELLAAWVRRAAVTSQSSIAANRGGPQRPINRAGTQSAVATRTDVKLPTGSAFASGGTKPSVPTSSARPSTIRKPANATPPAVVPANADIPVARDPFDPEIFNRQFHPAKTSANGKAAVPSGPDASQ